MGVSDRVMGDARETYLPSASVEVVVVDSDEDEQQEEDEVDNGRIVNNDDIVDIPAPVDQLNPCQPRSKSIEKCCERGSGYQLCCNSTPLNLFSVGLH